MNRNIFKLVFNRKHNTYVVAPETACGQHKTSSRVRGGATSRTARVFRLGAIAAAVALCSPAAFATTNLALPSGYAFALDNGTGADDGSYTTPNVFQTYSFNFTASDTGNNYLLFAFRQDPAFWTFGNVSVVLSGTSNNLLVDPTFTQGGAVSGQSGLQAPADWGIVYQAGTTPRAAGHYNPPGAGTYSTTNVNSGTAGSWYDGAVGSFDGIYQGVDMVAGDTYTVSFTALSNNAVTVSSVELGVFAGPCVSLTGSVDACTPDNANFVALATPTQTSNAGVTATPITTNVQASTLAGTATSLPEFNGGTLTLDGTSLTPYTFTITGNNGTIDTNGQSATISNAIANQTAGVAGGLTVANSGSGGGLTLTGVNTYTGATTVNSGASLSLAGSGSIASSSGLTDNGNFDISGANGNESIASLAGNGTVALGSNSLALTNANGAFSGTIGGSGGVIMNGGTETLSGVNTYTGGTTMNGGTLQVSADNNLGASTGALIFNGGTLENTATFTTARNIDTLGAANFDTDAGTTLTDTAGTITGTGPINKTGTGTLILGTDNATGGVNVNGGTLQLTGASTDTGATTVANGATLALTGNGSIANSSGMTNNGTFDISGSNSSQSITSLTGNGQVALGNNGLTLTNANGVFSGTIGGNGGVTLSGGTETLLGANTYTGPTTLNGGTLQVSADTNLGASTGALDFNGGTLENTVTFTTTRNIAMTGAANFNTAAGTVLTDTAGTITGSGPIDKSGTGTLILGADHSIGGVNVNAGTLQLTGASTDTGATNIANGGTLALTGNGSIASSSGVTDNGTFNISGANTAQSISSLAGNGQAALGNNGLTLTNAHDTFSGVIGGAAGVTVSGGTESLAGANTYSGATSIANGATLTLTGNGSIANSNGVTDNGTLNLASATGNRSVTSLAGNGNVALGANSLALTNANGTFGGVIGGSGGVTMNGGNETLSGANTYTGGTTLNGGTLQVSADNNLGASTGALNFNGGTLENTASFTTTRNIAMTGAANFNTAAGTVLTDTAGTISGTGPINKSGAGTLVLGSDHSNGGINVNGGMLQLTGASTDGGATNIATGAAVALSGNGSLASASSVTDNGTFDISGANADQSFASLAGNGAVVLGNNSLALTNANGTFGGNIAGNGGVAVTGGTETLSGGNSYTGATSVGNGGVLAVSGAGSIANSSGVTNNGTLDLSGATGKQSVASLGGSGNVALGNNGLTLTNASGTFSGVIDGSGGVTMNGGNETLSGANTYTGGTTLAGGTLQVSADNNLGASTGPFNFNGGTLENTASFTTTRNINAIGTANFTNDAGTTLTDTAGTITGGGSINKSGTGTLILGTDNASGGLNVNGGTLQLTGAGTGTGATRIANGATLALTGSGSIASSSGVTNNGTFDISGATSNESITTLSGQGAVALGNNNLTLTQANGAFSGDIAGNGGIAVMGGAETLTGANTYSGGTSIVNAALTASSIGSGPLTLDGGAYRTSSAQGATNPIVVGAQGGLIDNGGYNDTFGGPISGSGHLSFTGNGVTTVSGVNTYSGGTTITQSTVSIASAGNLGSGPITLDAGILRTTQAISETAPITVGAGNGEIDNGGFNNLIAGNISGVGAMLFAGSGTTTLTGTNTYTGGTTVNTGTLQLGSGGTIVGTVAVQQGGVFLPGSGTTTGAATNSGQITLTTGQTATFGSGLTNYGLMSGAGTVKGNLTNAAGGVFVVGDAGKSGSGVTPNAAGGATTVQGNLTLQEGGNFIFAIAPTATPTAGPNGLAPDNAHTQLNVTGNITIGGKATVYATAGNYLKTTYLLIDDANQNATLTGTFSSVDTPGLSNAYGTYMTYNPDPQVMITVFPTAAFAGDAHTGNQKSVATALDNAVPTSTGTVESELNTIYTQNSAGRTASLDRLDGELYADAPAVLTAGVRDSWNPVFNRIGLSGSVDPATDKSVWMSSTGSVGQLQGDGNADGVHGSTGGFLAGAQSRHDGWTYGVTGGSTHVSATRNAAEDGLGATLWQAGAFVARSMGAANAGLLFGYSQGSVDYASASQHAQIVTAQARVDRSWALGGGNSITPLIAIDAAHLNLDATHEHDPALGLTIPGQNETTADARAMLRFDHAWTMKSSDWVASAGVGVRQLLTGQKSSLAMGFNGISGSTFTVNGVGEARTVGDVTAGVTAHMTNRLSLEVSYEGQYGSRTRNNEFTGRLDWSF